ncbi:GNAT family N-acetyltransferase [Pseudohongiella sp. SYSU M77423]|uniref:GNAT family N-acetyltransferase n=1 Tax=Pseudohongiella sp. SYSU M77423 TaxID=3042312 RepID=UPI00247FCE2E|nr:GNAT family N-acetyltransferase [Pseudohongiella sp. SYSU M77423]MDH7943723.1 GNAT family N-acetyltransferase [Pseudohongiella sp. SYSU M77423]
MHDVKQKYLERLADEPRWVETRDLLASDRSLALENPTQDGFIVWSTEDDIGSVVGKIDSLPLLHAANQVSELLVFADNVSEACRVLKDFRAELAIIFASPPELPTTTRHDCRRMQQTDAALLDHLPEALKKEILDVLGDDVPVVAAFDGALPVAFAYAASETEALWDISIDTLASHRRRGFAASAVTALMGIMEKRGKTAVWGALQSNPASVKLAQHLGFREVDELWVLSREDTGS